MWRDRRASAFLRLRMIPEHVQTCFAVHCDSNDHEYVASRVVYTYSLRSQYCEYMVKLCDDFVHAYEPCVLSLDYLSYG